MIIESIRLRNFGLYKGDHTIDLTPKDDQNVILISGQNGVGKSTLQEALHLCLHSSLAIDSRVTDAQYSAYLSNRSYRGDGIDVKTEIEVCLSFTREGKVDEYRVLRKWQKASGSAEEEVLVWQNGEHLTELSLKEKNSFLRELVNPGFAKVIFFDGEKLSSFYQLDNLKFFLEDGCRSLFGLDYVELLKKDLDYYTDKLINKPETKKRTTELNDVVETLSEIESEMEALKLSKAESEKAIKKLQDLILEKEREIAKQGRWATKKLDKYKSEKQKAEERLKVIKKKLVEVYSHMGPFVFSGNILSQLKKRLVNEREIEKWQHAQELLLKKAEEVKAFLSDNLKSNGSTQLFEGVQNVLLSKPQTFPNDEKIHHEIADNDRSKLISWIDNIDSEVKKLLIKSTDEIWKLEKQIKQLNKELNTFSESDIVKPLLQKLQQLNKDLGGSEQKYQSISKKLDEAKKRHSFYKNRKEWLEDKLIRDNSFEKKLQLSTNTKKALEQYEKQLLSKKLKTLESLIVDKFNRLCRKKEYFDAITIEPSDFGIRLWRKGIETNHKHLSAGEKQLLVLAILWGFRDMTNISLPLIIDTPLARLDREHRDSFVNDFLPAIEPQVICIGTDMEIDREVTEVLKPFTVHHYQLSYDYTQHATVVSNYKELEPLKAS